MKPHIDRSMYLGYRCSDGVAFGHGATPGDAYWSMMSVYRSGVINLLHKQAVEFIEDRAKNAKR